MANRPPVIAAWGAGADCTVMIVELAWAHLDRDWSVGDQAREISSVLSAGRFEARVYDCLPPFAIQVERPRYE